MNTNLRALIAGAGVAGLTAARAFHNLGWDVDLVERRNDLDVVPTGLFIPANGMRAFAALDSAAALISQGQEIDRLGMRATGGSSTHAPLSAVWPDVGPSIAINRLSAQRTLLEVCPVTVQWGKGVQEVSQQGKRVTVTMSDGARTGYDLVIGADGVNSAVRLQTWPGTVAQYAGDYWWRGVVACPPSLESWDTCLCDAGIFVAMPIGAGLAYWATGCFSLQQLDDPSDGRAERVRRLFGDADGPHAEILAQVKDDSRVQFSAASKVLVEQPAQGRVVLLGDAAHAIGPSMAQGASMAAEDVQVLTQELVQAGDVDEALTRYAARRKPRTRYVHETTEMRNRLALNPPPDPTPLVREWPRLSVQSFAALVPAP
jgi:2-polyprenyl-6-methoxyphenol hydroxylase-like FAD-dependent oxidoreductase